MTRRLAHEDGCHWAESIPLIDIICHPWFREGFVEAAQGLPPQLAGDTRPGDRDRWFYQCGHLVAAEARSTHGRVPPLWCGEDAERLINPQVISLAGAMLLTGAFA